MMTFAQLFHSGVENHVTAIRSLSADALIPLCELLISTYRGNGRVFLAGNGGSAADAQHIAAELVGRFKKNRRALSAVALTTDTSCLTAIGNDYGFEDIFSRQIEAHFQEGDLLWILSVSGSSPNIAKAAKTAKQMGGQVILFTGKKCSELLSVVDVAFVADAESSDVVQECHQFAYHLLCDWVESSLASITPPTRGGDCH